MQEICMSSLKRGRDMDNQAWYAVLRHRRGNPDTRFAVTYPYCCTLSTLPADGTLAPEPVRGCERTSGASQEKYRSGFRRTWVCLGERGRKDSLLAGRGESLFSRILRLFQ